MTAGTAAALVLSPARRPRRGQAWSTARRCRRRPSARPHGARDELRRRAAGLLEATGPEFTAASAPCRAAWTPRSVPARGYPLALIPPVPLPRHAEPGPAAGRRAQLREAVLAARGRLLDRVRAEVVVSASAATWPGQPISPTPRSAACRYVVHEAERPARSGRPFMSSPGMTTRRVHRRAGCSRLAHATAIGIPLRPTITAFEPARAARRQPGSESACDPTRPVLAGHAASSQGARAIETPQSPARPRAAAGGQRARCPHITGPQARGPGAPTVTPPAATSSSPYRQRDAVRLTPRPDFAVCRSGAMTCRRTRRHRPASPCTCRCRCRGGEQPAECQAGHRGRRGTARR